MGREEREREETVGKGKMEETKQVIRERREQERNTMDKIRKEYEEGERLKRGNHLSKRRQELGKQRVWNGGMEVENKE